MCQLPHFHVTFNIITFLPLSPRSRCVTPSADRSQAVEPFKFVLDFPTVSEIQCFRITIVNSMLVFSSSQIIIQLNVRIHIQQLAALVWVPSWGHMSKRFIGEGSGRRQKEFSDCSADMIPLEERRKEGGLARKSCRTDCGASPQSTLPHRPQGLSAPFSQ